MTTLSSPTRAGQPMNNPIKAKTERLTRLGQIGNSQQKLIFPGDIHRS